MKIIRAFAVILAVFLFSPFLHAEGGSEVKSQNPLVLVINYPYQIWDQEPTRIHVTLFKPDFTPAKGASVKLNGKDVGKADENGTCVFDLVPGSSASHNLTAELSDNGTVFTVKKSFACNARTMSFKTERLYVYTDRGVYNPGQDILVRLVAWELKGEYTALKNAKVQLLFQDLKGKVYSGEYITTDDFGIASAKLPLPLNMTEGDYELVVLFQQARESARLRVERFVPPVINISHNLKRYITNKQDTLDVEVNLSYFAGGDFKKSKLTLSILAQDKQEVFTREYSSEMPGYKIRLSKNDLDGIRKKLSVETGIRIRLKAEDAYGQVDDIEWDVLYTARPFTAIIEIDKDSYPEGEVVQILAKVTDIDKQPAAGIKLEMEVSGIQANKALTTDGKGVAVFEFTMPAFAVNVTIKSPVMDQPLGTKYIPYEPAKPMISKASELPKKAGTKTKITVNFNPQYKPVEKVIHIDLTDISGALVESTTIPVRKSGDTYTAEGEVTAPTWGTMLANLYCCAAEKDKQPPYSVNTVGFITEGQHITFYPDRELEIVVDNFRPDASPGDEVVFNISVKGGKGEKALGVSVVDSAVISLLDPLVRPPVTHFYNPEVKVIATGGAGVLTWPVVDRNWGEPWRDIAYSNWGWKGPGNFISSGNGTETSGEESEAVPSTAYKNDADGMGGNDFAYKESSDDIMYDKKSKSLNEEEKKAVEENDQLDKAKTTNGDSDRRDGDTGGEKGDTLKIIIRTNFPETSLWEPHVKTQGGKAVVRVTLPDEITTQQLAVFASDQNGYIGVLRKEIKVSKPVFIRADFPASIVQGDTINARALLRNLTDKALACTVSIVSDKISVLSGKEFSVTLQPYETGIAGWEIKAAACGQADYTVAVKAGGYSDAEKKSLYVLPAGDPLIRTSSGAIDGKGKYTEKIFIEKGLDYYTSFLNVTLPNVFPAFQAWYAFEIYPWYSPWAVAGTAIMNSALLEYNGTLKKETAMSDLLVQKLEQAALFLTVTQLPSGGWSFYFDPGREQNELPKELMEPSLYYSLYCLRGLLDIKKSGIAVADTAIRNAVHFVLSKQNQDKLWSSKGAYFWDVYNDQTDYALSAEIFEVLSCALKYVDDPYGFEAAVRAVKDRMVKILSSRSDEPMTVSAILAGLMCYKVFSGDSSIDKLLSDGIDQLIALKRLAYWEPHWYHAYGGMVELNARILTLLAEYKPDKYQSYLREGVTWLLSTREAWGAWHNEIGTANAIIALLKAGVFGDEDAGSDIEVKINGKKAVSIAIDPADPFLSAAKLNYLEITKWLTPGDNTVEVAYTGKLKASVILETRKWGKETDAASGVEVKKSMPKDSVIGQPVTVRLSFNAKKTYGSITIEEPLPSQCSADESSLDALVKAGVISGYRIDGQMIVFSLIQFDGKTELKYKLKPIMKGTGIVKSTRILDAQEGVVLGISAASTFVVQ